MTLRSQIAAVDTDLTIGAAIVAASALLILGWSGSPIAWIVGIPFLLLWPGYALTAAILPEKPVSQPKHNNASAASHDASTSSDESSASSHDASTSRDEAGATSDDVSASLQQRLTGSAQQPTNPETAGNRRNPPGWAARLGLSLVLSAIVVAVAGVVVDRVATISLGPVVGAITLFTFVALAVAAHRRQQLPVAVRANPLNRELPAIKRGSRRQHATLAVAVLLLVGAVAVVGAAPPQGEAYSESYLLAEGADGELTAEEHPTTFVAGESQPLFVGLANHEHQPVSYTVVVVAETIDSDGTVTNEEQVDTFSVDLAHDESTVVERPIAPTTPGETVRLQFQIYTGTEPTEATEPDQTTQLWIEVVDSGG